MIILHFQNILRNFRRRKISTLIVFILLFSWCSFVTFCTTSKCLLNYDNALLSQEIDEYNLNREFNEIGKSEVLGFRIHNRNLQNLNPRELFHLPEAVKELRSRKQKSTLQLDESVETSVQEDEIKSDILKISFKDSKEVSYKNTNSSQLPSQHQSKKLPQVIIIGVKKCGTRALLEFLRLHPDVRATGPEPHFFDKHYEKGLAWYREKMPSTNQGQLTIEKTPSYFVTKDVSRRLYNMSKQVKLLVVVRDPVTRAISDYAQVSSKRPDIKTFEAMAFLDNSTRIIDTSWTVIRIGVYAKHMQNWLKYFPLTQFHFVNGENLISNPGGEMKKVQQFLGLKPLITKEHFYFNSTRGFPCIRKNIKSRKTHCLDRTKGRKHPYVSQAALKRLRDFYRPFNAKFYHMVREDFHWI